MAFRHLSSRCLVRSKPRIVSRFRNYYTAEDGAEPLKTTEDWAEFILKRGDYKSLGELSISHWPMDTILTVRSGKNVPVRVHTDAREHVPTSSSRPPTTSTRVTDFVRPHCCWRTSWAFTVAHELQLFTILVWRTCWHHRHRS
jgi:hypothetical protein